jgi:copper chaperone
MNSYEGISMFTLKVSGMTCGGCISAITRAVQAQDPQAQVQADLATQSVSLETALTPELVTQLLEDAGYPVSK